MQIYQKREELTLVIMRDRVEEMENFRCLMSAFIMRRAYSHWLTQRLKWIPYMIILIATIRLGLQTIFLQSFQKQVRLINSNDLDLPVTFHKKIKSSGYGS